jgi:hypothetical protein
MWWDKFGYPEWMLSRYVGEHWDVFYYWWFDNDKEIRLEKAMGDGKQLETLPLDTDYWPNYLKANK